jgi:hypothetical protein
MTSPETPVTPPRMDRRDAIKWMMTAAASTAFLDRHVFGATAADAVKAGAKRVGYGTDPDLLKAYKPGELWPLTFNETQRAAAAALCDVIIPADEKGPTASSVGVHDFIDEWISAPYDGHDRDKKIVVDGLAWVDTESRKRFGKIFTGLTADQKNAICDDICYAPNAKPEFRTAAAFFGLYRNLTSGGYYSTVEGMRDIGYTGNVALEKFEGPPREVLQKLGLV